MYKALIAAALLSATSAKAIPVPSEFTYQGQLVLNNQPVDGTADLTFRLFDGVNLVATDTIGGVAVSNGLFAVDLDFGPGLFDGTAYDIEIAARSPAGSGGFTTLSPRQPLKTTPYAFHANTANTLIAPATIDLPSNDNAALNVSRGTNLPSSLNFNSGLSAANIFGEDSFIGVLGGADNFPITGLLDENDAGGNAAAVLGQIFGPGAGQIAVWAIGANSNSAALGTSTYAGDFSGDVRIDGNLTKAFSPFSFDDVAPIAYGFVYSNGTVASGTPNFSVVYNNTSERYEIEIDNETYFFDEYVTVVTTTRDDVTASTSSLSGRLLVEVESTSTQDRVQANFQFITYRTSAAAIAGRNRPALTPLDPALATDDELYARRLPREPRQPIVEPEGQRGVRAE